VRGSAEAPPRARAARARAAGGALPVLVLVAAGLAAGIAVLRRVWPFTIDDAFITFRYAQNLAAGHGPTFNPGMPPVEGCTTFAWMLLLSVPHALHVDAAVFSKWAGTCCGLALLGVTWRFAHATTDFASGRTRRVAAAGAVLALGVMPATAVHAVSGMETMLFALLLTALFERMTRAVREDDRRALGHAAVLGALVGMTRPEGHVAVVIGFASALLIVPPARRRPLVRIALMGYVLPTLVHQAWRWAYYGLPFPLSFYVKVEGTGWPGAAEVQRFLAAFATRLGPLLGLGIARVGRGSLPAALAGLGLLGFFLFAEPIMAYEWRYLYPILPSWCALAAAGAAFLVEQVGRRVPGAVGRGAWLWQPTLAAVALVGLWLLANDLHRDASEVIAVRRSYAETLRRAHFAIAHELAAIGVPGDRPPVLAVADAGAIPYYSGWRSIDVVGLNDRHLARHGPDPAYVLAQSPDLVLLNSKSDERFEARQPWMQDLYAACIRAGMQPFHVWRMRLGSYYVWMLGRPGSAVVQQLAQRRSQAAAAPRVQVECSSCRSVWMVQVSRWFRPEDDLVPYTVGDRFECPRCGRRIDLTGRR
jgi:hypothetical protein